MPAAGTDRRTYAASNLFASKPILAHIHDPKFCRCCFGLDFKPSTWLIFFCSDRPKCYCKLRNYRANSIVRHTNQSMLRSNACLY
jgi:hypothetical protein